MLAIALAGSGVSMGEAAANCAPRSARSPELLRLERQIAANRAFEVKYSCALSGSFACREIAGRIAQATKRIQSLSSAVPHQICERPVAAKRVERRRILASPLRRAPVRERHIVQAGIETRCVRLSDGYYFPTPNSGYNTPKDIEAIVAQCKFICDDPAMDVYRMTGTDRNADDMVSLVSGARYADLPKAGTYRSAAPLKTCDMNRFYRMVMASTPAKATKPVKIGAQSQPEIQPVTPVAIALLGDVGLRGTTGFLPSPVRKVRIVGATFLPEE